MLGLGRHAVFVDANVLYSRTQRDWLAMLYLQSETFQVFWTEDVVSEAIYHLRKDHSEWDGGKIAAVRDHICGTFEVGRVTDFVVDGTGAIDPDDAHVHAAAVACQADLLLTDNVKDFPDDASYEAVRPDDFFQLVDDSDPAAVRQIVRKQLAYWSARPGRCDLPAALAAAGCRGFSDRVKGHLQAMALEP